MLGLKLGWWVGVEVDWWIVYEYFELNVCENELGELLFGFVEENGGWFFIGGNVIKG